VSIGKDLELTGSEADSTIIRARGALFLGSSAATPSSKFTAARPSRWHS
jgi:hypothetical protein